MIPFSTFQESKGSIRKFFGKPFKPQTNTTQKFTKAIRAAIMLSALLLGSVSAFAVTKTWVSTTTGGTWTTAASWSPSGAPVAGDDVIINYNGTTTMTFNLSGAVPSTGSFASLTIGGTGSGTVLLTGSGATIWFNRLNVGNNLTLNGVSNSLTAMTGMVPVFYTTELLRVKLFVLEMELTVLSELRQVVFLQ